MIDDDDFNDNVLTYTDILGNIEALKREVENLDDDSLVDEVSSLQYNIEGRESNKIHSIALKNFNLIDLTDDDREFLKNIYLTYYSAYAILVDEEDENEG